MRFRLLFLLLALAISVPFASADTILNLNFTQVAGFTHTLVGTVDLHQMSAGVVQVTLTAKPGFSFKLTGGDVMFNTTSGVTLTAGDFSGLTAGVTPVTGSFTSHPPQTLGPWTFGLRNLQGGGGSATTISFLVSANNLTVADFTKVGVHFCIGSTCSGLTGFATQGSTVPEPGTLSLLGTGILGLAGFFRRRLIS